MLDLPVLKVKVESKKVLVTFHEQLRILQFNNQNLHNAKIIHINYNLYV
jgi:hypothetical protein